jgi:hypothetical protein
MTPTVCASGSTKSRLTRRSSTSRVQVHITRARVHQVTLLPQQITLPPIQLGLASGTGHCTRQPIIAPAWGARIQTGAISEDAPLRLAGGCRAGRAHHSDKRNVYKETDRAGVLFMSIYR